MSCGGDFHTGNCVCDILAEIAEHQQDTSDDCLGSCSESIRELMGGMAPSNFNTIPIQLICNSPNTVKKHPDTPGGFCGNVFIAQGFRRALGTSGATGAIERVTAAFFRVQSVDTETCCAVLELLCVKEKEATSPNTGPDLKFGPDPNDLDECLGDNVFTPKYTRTGICINIDLNCFCGVVCLPAAHIRAA
ncbi:hypothetical protein AC623_14430 [Bacillus sp. FJAT-27231]|uniref:CotY/CotZ family spore coat protein n=1 Tax=Bacillus sp. FJAT-27231 TaxID=1679168 RepID=UPI0006710BAD|nr:CotY/CotZ family spore coat protein [Bacillus sp. FJAT-27231]KMY54981.1 hypothetical protein AC623_14430 [Bacillus sp. FJAT-27231]